MYKDVPLSTLSLCHPHSDSIFLSNLMLVLYSALELLYVLDYAGIGPKKQKKYVYINMFSIFC